MLLPNWSALEGTESQESRLGALLEDLNVFPEDVTLIVDRAEDLSEDAAVLLNDVMLGLGDGHRVLVGQCGGSHLSPLPFLTNGQAEIIGMKELTFSAEETQALAAQFPDVSKGQALKIYNENTGWPLGTVLGLHRPVVGHLSGHNEVLDRLVARLPAPLQQGIAGLAVLNLWNGQEAQRAGLTLPGGWLRDVLKIGLPLTPEDDGLIPHALVTQYLDERLQARPEAYRALHRHWAQQEQGRNRPYSAIHHALLAGTPEHAVQLAESLAARWRRAKNWSVVTGTLGTLPQEHLTPGLLALLALARLETGETKTVVGLLSGVQYEDQTALGLIVLARLAVLQGRLDDALIDTQRGLQIATQEVDIIGLLQLRARIVATQSQSDEAIEDAQDALQRATRLGAADVRIEALGTLGTVYSRLGRIGEAVSTIALSVEMAFQSGYVNRVITSILYLKNQYLCMGRIQEADDLLRRYLEAARVTSPKGVLAGEMALGHLLFVKGEVAEAETLLRASFDLFIEQSNYIEAHGAFNPLLDLLLETGQHEVGRRLWRQLYGFMVVDQDPWDRINKMNSDALLLHAEGQYAQAEEQVLSALRLAATISPVMLFQTELLRLDLKRIDGTLEQHDLAALSAAYEADPDYHIEILQTWRIYSALQSYGHGKHWNVPLFALVAKRREHERNSGEKPETARLSISLKTLGDGQMLIGGTPFQITSQTHEEVLAYLAVHALTPDLLQQDAIARAIWGDGENDLKRARSSLRTSRYNINKTTHEALGTELIASGGRGRENTTWRLSPAIDVHCDVLHALQVTDPIEAAQLAPQAGTFLIHRRSEWVQDMRTRLAEHLAQVLTQGAAETERLDPGTALSWLVSAANLALTPEVFSAIERFGDRQRSGPLAEMAALTLRQAAEGQPLTFTNRALN
ncbi:hypothetical protein Q0M94_24510 (plasmid) [Deinococcus radiomollis]|uniref:hypothetical protein n=1 Tax=Deinococcus radiomollis TaxID=468916 RepID=UPI003891D113